MGFKFLLRFLGRGRAGTMATTPGQGERAGGAEGSAGADAVLPGRVSWGQVREKMEKLSDGFDRLATVARQYRESSNVLGKDLFALYEGVQALERQHLVLLCNLAGLADHCEQIGPNNNETVAFARESILRLLSEQGVERFVPKEGEPLDARVCEVVLGTLEK